MKKTKVYSIESTKNFVILSNGILSTLSQRTKSL